jgi:GTP-binding protein
VIKNAGLHELVSVQTFSSLKNTGVDDLKAKLQGWLAPEQEEIPTAE